MFDVEKVESLGPFCFSCLGRAVGRVGFGLDNRERGIELLNQFEIHEGADLGKKLTCTSLECEICRGLIDEIDDFIAISSAKSSKI